MSQEMPYGKPGEASRESLTIGIRACGKVLTWNLVSGNTIDEDHAQRRMMHTSF